MKLKYIFLVVCLANTNLLLLSQSQFNLQEAQKFADESEYHIRWQESVQAYQSPNRMHNIRTTFYDNSAVIIPRVDSVYHDQWQISYEVEGIYRNDRLLSKTQNKANEISLMENNLIFKNNDYSIQYINSNDGIRQNFIIEKQDKGEGDLIVKIKLTTDLISKADGQNIFFYLQENLSQPILVYNDIHAWDANGDKVEASIQFEQTINGSFIKLLANDKNAIYPLTIDPLTTTPNWVLQGDLATTYQIKYTAAGDFNGDGRIDLLTGAPQYSNGQTSEGIVKIHYGNASGTFNTVADWSYESNIASLNLGERIACAGDINNDGYDDILIGCNLYDNVQTNEGIAYMFLGSATVPSTTPDWAVESNTSSAEFGNSVAAAGDINNDGFGDVVIGAHKHTTTGRVFVYLGNATGLPLTSTILIGTGSGTEYGYFVGGNKDINADGFDDIVVTGTYRYVTGGPSSAGRVYVYNGSAVGITTTSSWDYSAKQASAHLGNSVATTDINSDGYIDLVVSAIDYDTIGTDYGMVYVFMNSASGLPSTPSQLFLGSETDEDLGTTVTDLGDLNNDGYREIAIGSPSFGTAIGRIYLLMGANNGLDLNPINIFTSNEVSGYSGRSVTATGDINGDSYDDFVAINAVYNEPDVASALLYYGSDAINSVFGLWNTPNSSSEFGKSIAHMDMNDDGTMDILIGAPYFDGGSTDEGKLFVYWADGAIIDAIPDWSVESQQASSLFPTSISSGGDFNNDGYSDIAVTAKNFEVEFEDDGAVFIYYGNEEHQPNEWMRQTLHGGADFLYGLLGEKILGLGDINSDGYDDISVSAPYYDGFGSSSGIVYVYGGSEEGIIPEPIWQFSHAITSSNTGSDILNGDFNGDGLTDLFVAAENYDMEEGSEGRIDIFYGSPSGFPTTPSWTKIGAEYWYQLGERIGGGGDVNGDGYADFIVNETFYHSAFYDSTRFLLFYGTAADPVYSGWTTKYKLTNNQGMGDFLWLDGDLNGDGYDEMIFSNFTGHAVYIFNGGLYRPEYSFTTLTNIVTASYFGRQVNVIPDINNDGLDELLIGASKEPTNYGLGTVHMYYGTPTACAPSSLNLFSVSETSADFNITGTADVYYFKWKKPTEAHWKLDSTILMSVNLTSLDICSDYQIIIQSGCADEYSAWSEILNFTTDCSPCSTAPTGLYADNITPSSAKLHWIADPDATKYKVSYRKTGVAAWTNINATSNFKTISGLTPSSTYQYKVKTICGPIQSVFSPISTFTTLPLKNNSEFDVVAAIYPNPANDILNVSNNFNVDRYEITDLFGRVVKSDINSYSEIFQLDIGSLSNGLYHLHLQNSDNTISKVIVFAKI